MAVTKFSEAEREKLFAQLEAPFDPALIKWRVMRSFDNGRSGVILPFADPRAFYGGRTRSPLLGLSAEENSEVERLLAGIRN